MATASTKQAWARGGTVFAATLLLLIGVYQFFIGIAGIATNNFFVVGANYTYVINTTAWGWIHLGIGVVAFLTGLALFTGTLWARALGIGEAVQHRSHPPGEVLGPPDAPQARGRVGRQQVPPPLRVLRP